jgi:hypothetical protein
MAAPGEKVLLSGGQPIMGDWQSEDGQVYYVDIPEIADAGQDWRAYKEAGEPVAGRWHFRQLFVNGRREIRARYPNASLDDPYLYAIAETREQYMPAPEGSVKRVWGDEPDAQIWANIDWNGYNVLCDITHVDTEKDRIHITTSSGRWRITGYEEHRYDKPDWFYIEGVLEDLDEPREWHLDPMAGRLYYWPEDGAMEGKEVIAPRLHEVIRLDGDPVSGTHVDYVHPHGLEIAHARFTLDQMEPRVILNAAVIMVNARHCRVEECEIYNVGANGLWLRYDCHDNVIARNTVRHTGCSGILTGGARGTWMGDESTYSTATKVRIRPATFRSLSSTQTVPIR